MTEKVSNFLNQADKEELISFIGEVAKKILPILETDEEIYQKAKSAIDDLSEWIEKNDKKAIKLYEHIYPLAILDDHFEINSKEDHAFFCIVNALYYIIWEIDNIERVNHGDDAVPQLPSDMADVNSETAYSCVDDAIDAADNADRFNNWMEIRIDKM